MMGNADLRYILEELGARIFQKLNLSVKTDLTVIKSNEVLAKFYFGLVLIVIQLKLVGPTKETEFKSILEILNFRVQPRHKGWGTWFIRKLLESLKPLDLERIELIPKNERAERFWLNNGFQIEPDISEHKKLLLSL